MNKHIFLDVQIKKLKFDQGKFDNYPSTDAYKLKDRDQVIVRKYPDFQYQKNISIH